MKQLQRPEAQMPSVVHGRIGTHLLDRLCAAGDLVERIVFSGKEFHLESLEGLEDLIADRPLLQDAKEIVLDGNALTSLFEIQVFANLVSIQAARNQLRWIAATKDDPTCICWNPPIRFQQLLHLDLSYNQLRNIPPLRSMPNLAVLMLNHNQISSFENLETGKSLKRLNIAGNLIMFSTEPEFVEGTRCFTHLHHLQEVYLDKNLFIQDVPRYALLLLKQCSHGAKYSGLSQIDQVKIDEQIKRLAASITIREGSKVATPRPSAIDEYDSSSDSVETYTDEPDELKSYVSRTSTTYGHALPDMSSISTSSETHIPTLQDLNEILEMCFGNPSGCIEYSQELIEKVQCIVDHPELHSTILGKQLSDVARFSANELDRGHETLNEFLENLDLLSQRQPQLVETILRVVANMCSVLFFDVGQRCFKQLGVYAEGGEVLQYQVQETINSTIVPKIKMSVSRTTRDYMLANLIEVATSVAQPEILAGLVGWLCKSWKSHCEPKAKSGLTRTLVTASDPELGENLQGKGAPLILLQLASAIASHRTSAIKMSSHGAAECVVYEMSSDTIRMNWRKYSYLLEIMSYLCKFDIVDAQDTPLLGSSLPRSLKEARQSTHKYRSAALFSNTRAPVHILSDLETLSVGPVQHHTDDQVDATQVITKCIAALGSLANAKKGLEHIFNHNEGGVPFTSILFRLLMREQSGPAVITSILEAFTQILNAPYSWFPLGSPGVEKGDALEYTTMLIEVSAKLDGVVPLLNFLGEGGSRYANACLLTDDGDGHVNGVVPKLRQQHSEKIHKLLTSVLNVLEFYCRSSKLDLPNCEFLHNIVVDLDSHNREQHLFNCLETPSDEVRLAAVNCLLSVPVDELDGREVAQLVTMVQNEQQVSKGQTEKVLAASFQLMGNLCFSNTKSGQHFRDRHIESAVEAAFSVLQRNEVRKTSRHQIQETMQKQLLSESCVTFLKVVSAFPFMRGLLSDPKTMKMFLRITQLEGQSSLHSRLHPSIKQEELRQETVPVLLEETWAGRQVEYLMQALVSNETINPLGTIGPRYLRRMANVLMGIRDPSAEEYRQSWMKFQNSKTSEYYTADESVAEAESDEEKLDSDFTFHREPGSLSSQLTAEVLADQAIRNMSDPAMGPLESMTSAVEQELRMSAWWDLGLQNGTAFTDLERAATAKSDDREHQHEVFSYYQGPARLLLYMAKVLDSSYKAECRDEENVVTLGMPSSQSDGSTVAELLRNFHVLDVVAKLQQKSANWEKRLEVGRTGPEDQRSDVEEVANDTDSGGSLKMHEYANGDPDDSGESIGFKVKGDDEVIHSRTDTASHPYTKQTIVGKDALLAMFLEDSKKPETANVAQDSQFELRLTASDTQLIEYDCVTPNRNCESESTEAIAGALRVFYSLLNFGTVTTEYEAASVLRKPSNLKLLVVTTIGERSGAFDSTVNTSAKTTGAQPRWVQGFLGAKLMRVLHDVCQMPSIGRSIPFELLNTFAIASASARTLLAHLASTLAHRGNLGPSGMVTAFHVSRLLALLAEQLRLVEYPDPDSEAGAWELILPFQGVVRPLILVLLYVLRVDTGGGRIAVERRPDAADKGDLEAAPPQHSRASGSGLMGQEPWVRDGIRQQVESFLVECLLSCPSYQYPVLQVLNTSDMQSGLEVLSAFIHQLFLRRRHAAYKAAVQSAFTLEASVWPSRSMLGVVSHLTGNSNPPESQVSSPGGLQSVLASCLGWRRRPAALAVAKPVRAVQCVLPPPPRSRCEADDPSSEEAKKLWWQRERVGEERVMTLSWVSVARPGALQRCGERRLLVLSSEAVYLFAPVVGHDGPLLDAEQVALPRAVCRIPYHSIRRVVPGTSDGRVHLEFETSENQRNKASAGSLQRDQLCVLGFSSVAAAELSRNLLHLSRVWCFVMKELGCVVEEVQIVPDVFMDWEIQRVVAGACRQLGSVAAKAENTRIVSSVILSRWRPRSSGKIQSSGNKSEDKSSCFVGIITSNLFVLCRCDWSRWAFPPLEDPRGQFEASPSEHFMHHSKHMTHELSDLVSVEVSSGTIPSVVVEFGRIKSGSKEVSAMYQMQFFDDISRIQWCRELAMHVA